MNKEDVVHIYNGILSTHKNEKKIGSFVDVDGPRPEI